MTKVAWDEVCYPKKEGGLGLKSMVVWNIYFFHVASCVESVCSFRLHLGCLGHEYLLKGKSFWSITIP
jgi:hypothetical protein